MKQDWEKELFELSGRNYRLIERLLNRFKRKEIGYSEFIYCITEKYEQDIKKIIKKIKQEKDKEYAGFSEMMNISLFKAEKQAKQEERERILKNIKKFHKQRWKASHNMVENISLIDLVEYLGIVLNK